MIPEGRDMQRNGRELKFIAGFILFFLIGQAGNYFLRRYAGDMVIHSLNAVPASVIINLLTPDEKTVARDIRICGPNVSMMIKRGCEGSEGMVLVLAAVLAFPAGIRKKLTAVLIGIIIVYVANLSRIVHPGSFPDNACLRRASLHNRCEFDVFSRVGNQGYAT